MDTLYLDNIDEYVYDQDKIVTYKWLSLTLGVHVNTAKRMLFHYLEHKRSHSSDSLHATYLLTGKTEDAGLSCQKVCVVREDQLEDAKSKLSVVGSVHVYSVHKALLRDSAPLFAVDYDIVKSHGHNCNRYSAIRCPAAVPMSNARLSESTETRPAPRPPSETQKPQSKACPKPKGIMGAFASKPKTETKTETKPEPRTEAKPGTKPETKTEAKAEITEKPVSEPKAAKSKPALNFFGNKSTKKPVPEVKEESSSTEQRPPQAERDPRSKSKRVQESDSEEEVKEVKKKRRRRIRRPQDSSDEDEGAAVVPDSPPAPPPPQQEKQKQEQQEQEDQEEEEQQEDHQEEEQASPVPVRGDPEQRPKEDSSRSSKPRKRRRVLKSSTFVDEDGSIVTEKDYVSESYSEGEEEEVQTKPGPSALLHPGPKPGSKPGPKSGPKAQNEKKKGTSAKATKQASIMGFFNRK